MLAFVAIILIVGFIQANNQKRPVSNIPSPTHALIKPEPSRILSQADLHLTAAQKSEVEKVEATWSQEKAKLLQAMSGFAPRQARADQINGSLQGYSELSRTYNTTREAYWNAALKHLDDRQRKAVEGGLR